MTEKQGRDWNLPLLVIALVIGFGLYQLNPDESTRSAPPTWVTTEVIDEPIDLAKSDNAASVSETPERETPKPEAIAAKVSEVGARRADGVATSQAQQTSTDAVVELNVTGLKSKQGTLKVAVFDKVDGFPDHTEAEYTVEFLLAEQDTFQLDALPPGDYSIAAYHDKNSDGKMNKGAFGIPSESYGFSNNARGTFGPPKFSAATIQLQSGTQVIQLQLK